MRQVEGHGDYWLLHQQSKPHVVAHVQLPKTEAEFDNILGFCLGKNHWCEYIEGDLSFLCVIAGFNAKEELKAEKSYGVKTYIEELQKVRVCCFVGWDDEKKDVPCMNTLMWAHYADSHKGVCIEYSLTSNTPLRDSGIIDSSSRSRLDKVIYKDGPISDRKSLNFNECFLIKDKSWKYENEYRLVHYDTIRNENYYNIPLSTLGLKIECIYFGINCDKRTMELVQNITRDRGIQYLKFDRNKDYMNSIKMR